MFMKMKVVNVHDEKMFLCKKCSYNENVHVGKESSY
jgi:hypothetical protein